MFFFLTKKRNKPFSLSANYSLSILINIQSKPIYKYKKNVNIE